MDRVRNLFAGASNYEAQEDDAGGATAGSATATEASTPSGAERGAIAEALDATTLSWSTRVKGFLICFGIGVFIAVLAAVMFSITFNLFTFGVLYTLGNVVAIASTLFLMGPVNQVGRETDFTFLLNSGRQRCINIAASNYRCRLPRTILFSHDCNSHYFFFQIKRMFSKERWLASTAMLAFLALTLVSAFVLQKKALTLLLVLFQFLAMTWYCLSYIPFARDAVIKFFDKIIS